MTEVTIRLDRDVYRRLRVVRANKTTVPKILALLVGGASVLLPNPDIDRDLAVQGPVPARILRRIAGWLDAGFDTQAIAAHLGASTRTRLAPSSRRV